MNDPIKPARRAETDLPAGNDVPPADGAFPDEDATLGLQIPFQHASGSKKAVPFHDHRRPQQDRHRGLQVPVVHKAFGAEPAKLASVNLVTVVGSASGSRRGWDFT